MDGAMATTRRGRWYHGWNIVAVCVLSQVAALGLTINCFSLFLPLWSKDFGLPVSTLTTAITIFSLGCSVVVPFAGAFADRFPARWLFGLALAGLAAFHVVIGFVTRGWQLLALYSVLLPVLISFAASVPAQALVSRWFVKRVGLAMGLTAFGLALAGVVLPPLVVGFLPSLGWRAVWWIGGAVIGLLVLPVVASVMRDRPGPADSQAYVGEGHAPAAAGPKLSVRDIFSRRNFWVVICVFVPVQCVSMGVTINLGPMIVNSGHSVSAAGGLLSLLSVAALAAKLLAGAAADKLGNRWPLVGIGLIAAAGAAILAVSGGDLRMIAAAMTLIGLSGGVWTLLASATAAEFGAQGFGRAFGLISAFTPLGSLAPPVVAKMQEVTGDYRAAFLGLAVLSVAGAAAGLLLNQPRARSAVVLADA